LLFLGCFRNIYVILVPASNNVLQYVSINQRECQAIYMQIYRTIRKMMKGGNYMVSLNSFSNDYKY